jgi:hypothetical protein
MSREALYRHCRPEKPTPTGTKHQVSYIPEPYCKVGEVLRLRNDAGEWEGGWVVTEASEDPSTHEEVNRASRAPTRHRAGSDI